VRPPARAQRSKADSPPAALAPEVARSRVAALEGGSSEARREALSALKADLDAFAPHGVGSRVRKGLDRALGRFGPARGGLVPALIACTKDADEDVRKDAVALLGDIGQEVREVQAALTEALYDSRAEVRAVAAREMRNVWAGHIYPLAPTLEALRHDDPDVRGAARSGLFRRYRSARSPFDEHDARAEVPALAEALGDPRADIRDVVALCLWSIGPRKARAAIPALGRALGDPDEHVRLHAASALLLIDPTNRPARSLLAGALPKLCEGAKGPPGGRRMGLFSWMVLIMNGGMPGPGSPTVGLPADIFPILGKDAAPALPILVDSLHVWNTRSYTDDKRGPVTATLVQIGPDALPPLLAALDDDDPDFRDNVALAVGAFAPKAKAAVPALVAAMAIPKDRPGRRPRPVPNVPGRRSLIGPLDALARFGPVAEPAVPAIVELLGGAEAADFQPVAIKTLGAIGPGASRAVPALVARLRDRWLGREAADALARIGPAARPALAAAMTGPDPLTRISAAGALLKIDPTDRAARALLADRLRGTPEDRIGAAVALADAGAGPDGTAVVAALLEASRRHLPREEWPVRISYLQATWRVDPGDRAAREALAECLHVMHPYYLRTTLDSFGYLGPRARPALPLVREALGDGDPYARIAAVQALARIDPASPATVRVLIPLLGDGDRFVRAHVASALGDFGSAARSAVPALEAALADGDVAVRETGAEALEKIRGLDPGTPADSPPTAGLP